MSTTIVGTPPTQRETRPSIRRLRRGQVIGGILLLALLLVVLLAAFGAPLWRILGAGILLLAVAVVVLLALGTLLITLGIAAFTRRRTRVMLWMGRLVRLSLVLLILLVGVAAAMFGSQLHTSTDPILGANGQPLPGSIATIEQVTLNGSQQWITIRGTNTHHPVLLYLTGGPGQGGFTANQQELAPLEKHFVVVNWDQPDTAKSYGAVPLAQLTPQRFVQDAHALVQLLRTRFHQDKIYIYGQSWGSILGILLVQQYPQLFYAFIGHGQMVNVKEDDIIGYQLALKYATEHGDTATVDTLRRNGPPPYYGEGLFEKEMAFIKVNLQNEMGPIANLPWYAIALPAALSPEYGWLDTVNYARGLHDVSTTMLPYMDRIDFTTQATRLQVPVYFLVGKSDTNAMPQLVEQYYHVLQAPHKELIWFNSGHGLEGDTSQFVDVMVNHVLKQTWPGR